MADYQARFDDDRVDVELIGRLLERIVTVVEGDAPTFGAILIFLPGYDEIMRLQALLQRHPFFGRQNNAWILPLHSACSPADQRLVFRKAKPGAYKIILSTNIAETSVTINDVVYVINSGKMKEKSFDSLTNVATLNSCWASRASAQQRKGRAGRCQAGVCYHLFSQSRKEQLKDYQAPELLRTPLDELCLQAKLLQPGLKSVAAFLAKAPEPPSARSIQVCRLLLMFSTTPLSLSSKSTHTQSRAHTRAHTHMYTPTHATHTNTPTYTSTHTSPPHFAVSSGVFCDTP